MGSKRLFACMFCDQIMTDPVVLPCQCMYCHIHIISFYKDKEKDLIKCLSCKEEFTIPIQKIQVHKRFKEAIENEEHLSEEEKEKKIVLKNNLNELDKLYDNLYCKQKQIERFSTQHFHELREEIMSSKEKNKTNVNTVFFK